MTSAATSQRQPVLSDAANPEQRQQPSIAQQLLDVGEHAFASPTEGRELLGRLSASPRSERRRGSRGEAAAAPSWKHMLGKGPGIAQGTEPSRAARRRRPAHRRAWPDGLREAAPARRAAALYDAGGG